MAATKNSKLKSPPPRALGEMENIMLSNSERLDKRMSIKMAKEERKKRKLEVEADKAKAAADHALAAIALEREKLKAERDKRENRMATERAERESRNLFQQVLLNFLSKQQHQGNGNP